MNKDIVAGHWKELEGKLSQKWAKITGDDTRYLKGTYEELEGLLQQRYGYAKDQADKELDLFLKEQDWDKK